MVPIEDLDTVIGGFRAGYENPLYFSRESEKLFGLPPQSDTTGLTQQSQSLREILVGCTF